MDDEEQPTTVRVSGRPRSTRDGTAVRPEPRARVARAGCSRRRGGTRGRRGRPTSRRCRRNVSSGGTQSIRPRRQNPTTTSAAASRSRRASDTNSPSIACPSSCMTAPGSALRSGWSWSPEPRVLRRSRRVRLRGRVCVAAAIHAAELLADLVGAASRAPCLRPRLCELEPFVDEDQRRDAQHDEKQCQTNPHASNRSREDLARATPAAGPSFASAEPAPRRGRSVSGDCVASRRGPVRRKRTAAELPSSGPRRLAGW